MKRAPFTQFHCSETKSEAAASHPQPTTNVDCCQPTPPCSPDQLCAFYAPEPSGGSQRLPLVPSSSTILSLLEEGLRGWHWPRHCVSRLVVYLEPVANPRPLQAASELVSSTNKITLLEGSNLDKVANWSLPPSEYSNRVSSITADNIEFLRCESGMLSG
jgi:hypothetical protein